MKYSTYILLISLLIMVGCDEPTKSDTQTEIQTKAQVGQNSDSLAGNHTRIFFISSDKWNIWSQDKDIKKQISSIVNTGKYNIFKIDYHRGYSGELQGAEIYYMSP